MRELAGSGSGEAGQCWVQSVPRSMPGGRSCPRRPGRGAPSFHQCSPENCGCCGHPCTGWHTLGSWSWWAAEWRKWLGDSGKRNLVYCERSSILLIQIGSARINNEMFPSSVLKRWQTVVVCYVFCVWLFVSDKPVGVFPVKNFFLSTQDFMDNSSFDVLWLWWKVFEYSDHEGSRTKALFSCSPYSQCRSWHSPRDFCLQLGLNWRFFHFLGECKRNSIYIVSSYCAFICWVHSHTQR